MIFLAKTPFLRLRQSAVVSVPPVFVAAGTVVQAASSGTSLNVPYYAGVAANDIALIFAMTFTEGSTIGTPAGHASLPQGSRGNPSSGHTRVSWMRLVGSESGSIAITQSGGGASTFMTAFMIGVRGAIASGTPVEGSGNAANTGTAETSSTITTSVPNTLGLRFGTHEGFDDTTAPAGWTEFADELSLAGVHGDWKTIVAAGVEPATTRTHSASDRWGTQTLAVLPP